MCPWLLAIELGLPSGPFSEGAPGWVIVAGDGPEGDDRFLDICPGVQGSGREDCSKPAQGSGSLHLLQHLPVLP